jgi:hypothetical protein
VASEQAAGLVHSFSAQPTASFERDNKQASHEGVMKGSHKRTSRQDHQDRMENIPINQVQQQQ